MGPAAETRLTLADAVLEEMEAAEAIEFTAEGAELTTEAADAHDEAVLDMIAMEMGAPDPFDADEIAAPVVEEAHLAGPPQAEPTPPPAVHTESSPEPALELSLGSSIIASGIVRRPVVAANDPLAPIRRMSQAEKIAFFS